MAGPYTIQTPVNGQPISSSLYGVPVRNAINDLHDRTAVLEGSTRICKLRQNTAQTGVASGADTVLTNWGTEDADANAWHDPSVNPTRITPDRLGWYDVGGIMVWAFNTVILYSEMFFRKNGTIVERSGNLKYPSTGQSNVSTNGGSMNIPLSVTTLGDYFEMGARHVTTGAVTLDTNGGSSTFTPRFWMRYAGPL